jgi:hypothetical protein
MPSPQTRPALLMARNTGPCVMAAAAVHACTVLFTHVGIGTVRTCPPCRPGRQSPNAPRAAGSTRASASTTRRGGAHSQSTWRPSRGHANRAVLTVSRNREAAVLARASASSPSRTPIRRMPFTRRIPAASSGLRRPASAASYATRRTAGELKVDGGRRIPPLLKVNPISEHDGAVEREPGLRTVPGDELADRVVVGALPAGGCQAVQHRRLDVLEVWEGQNPFGRLLLARFRLRHRRRPPSPSPTASANVRPCSAFRSLHADAMLQ